MFHCLTVLELIYTINSQCLEYWYFKVPSGIKEDSLDTITMFHCVSVPDISDYWYLKVNFLGPENLLWDISSLRWSLTLRYQKLIVYGINFIKKSVIGPYYFLDISVGCTLRGSNSNHFLFLLPFSSRVRSFRKEIISIWELILFVIQGGKQEITIVMSIYLKALQCSMLCLLGTFSSEYLRVKVHFKLLIS